MEALDVHEALNGRELEADRLKKAERAITSSGDSLENDLETSGSGPPFDLQSVTTCTSSIPSIHSRLTRFSPASSVESSALERPQVRPPLLSPSTEGFYTGVKTKREAEKELLMSAQSMLLYHQFEEGWNAPQSDVDWLPLVFVWLKPHTLDYEHSVVHAMGRMVEEDGVPEFQIVGYALDEGPTFPNLKGLVKHYAKKTRKYGHV
ncbi:hypothetical protein M3Y99_01964500 [Aphelenchoides fujianensis]|nr:hypothetical protein M3Y99_01964500 [Aphelenchoides fujianensis]